MTADETVSIEIACSSCGALLRPSDLFCESCGATVIGAVGTAGEAVIPAVDDSDPLATRLTAAPSAPPSGCAFCGGAIDGDGFCSTCGARARTWRDHWTESPSEWVGGVCDIGVRHVRNEDAMVLRADAGASSQAVLVVCDGVTSAPHSDRASLAAASEASRHIGEVIRSLTPSASPAVAAAALTDAIVAGCRIAQIAVLGVTRELHEESAEFSPSCTFAVAVVHHGLLAAGWCGDSRVYWLPDTGDAMQVSVDHSMATELMADGRSRAEAEADPLAHTITRWLGADSHDPFADTATVALDAPGWVLVCSDGLWNYITEASDLRSLAAAAVSNGAVGPVAVAESMAAVANDLGGNDNVTVALARVAPVAVEASEQNP